ncbi:hypothetical protein OsI_35526 [Oryza sativa Indica Group]|uniref:Uncharacterized protein n=1 Tax=Oryza sativa subsp. indica TaxID=39946 RepID=A2ZCM0_ORYSI|nr:hypothetical protein OsI_35526 [Oryza sativa Indica Group]
MAVAEVGGMLASAVLKVATQKLGAAIAGRVMLQWNFDKDLEGMKATLESVDAVLRDAERRSIRDAAVRLWLRRLKDAAYDISDMLDDLEAITSKSDAGKLGCVMIPNLTIAHKITLANKMKTISDELKEITNQHLSFRFTEDSSYKEHRVTDKRETSSKVEEARVVGRTAEKRIIISSLSKRMTEETVILPIYGIGGIGKTTLAKLVFNASKFRDYSKVWIYVSQTFDLNKISNSIISQVSESESQLTEREMINRRLDELLSGRKILIVLDDLWERDQFQLDDLKTMLKVGRGSRVIAIVTTRDKDIAEKICTTEPYKLEPLTDDMCWKIIKEKSVFEARDDKEQLENIGREIASKCGGVALAAKSLGYTLQPMKFDEWVSVRNNDIWKASTFECTSLPYHNVLASLRLSCSNMPPNLRLCFAYCAIFPKGHIIVKDQIIHQWNALGFIEQSDIFSTRQLGEAYVRQLLGLCFLQQTKAPSICIFWPHNAILIGVAGQHCCTC